MGLRMVVSLIMMCCVLLFLFRWGLNSIFWRYWICFLFCIFFWFFKLMIICFCRKEIGYFISFCKVFIFFLLRIILIFWFVLKKISCINVYCNLWVRCSVILVLEVVNGCLRVMVLLFMLVMLLFKFNFFFIVRYCGVNVSLI